jgi:hypothetical protein
LGNLRTSTESVVVPMELERYGAFAWRILAARSDGSPSMMKASSPRIVSDPERNLPAPLRPCAARPVPSAVLLDVIPHSRSSRAAAGMTACSSHATCPFETLITSLS